MIRLLVVCRLFRNRQTKDGSLLSSLLAMPMRRDFLFLDVQKMSELGLHGTNGLSIKMKIRLQHNGVLALCFIGELESKRMCHLVLTT